MKGSSTDSLYWVLPHSEVYKIYGGSYSFRAKAPTNRFKYQRSEYLITRDEIEASGLPAASVIRAIGFWNINGGINSLAGTLHVFLRNTADTKYSLGSSWTTQGFTRVFSDENYQVQVDQCAYILNLDPDSVFTYQGGCLYVAWEFSSPNGAVASFGNYAWCNIAIDSAQYWGTGTSSLPSTLKPSLQRPTTFLSTTGSWTDILRVTNIYALEKCPLGFGSPSPVGVRVINASNQSCSFNLTLTITDSLTGAVRYSSTRLVSDLESGKASTVSFEGWSPAIAEKVIYHASVPRANGESFILNNESSITGEITTDRFSYCNFNSRNMNNWNVSWPGQAIFAVKYFMKGAGMITGVNVKLGGGKNFSGNKVYGVVLNADGEILATSAIHETTGQDTLSVTTLQFGEPAELKNEAFFIGVAQLAGTGQWGQISTQWDGPTRGGINYTIPLEGGKVIQEKNPFNWRFMIEARVAPFTGVFRPHGFQAVAESQSEISLMWGLNYFRNKVLLVWSPDSIFGSPQNGKTYMPGDSITGGGRVLAYGPDSLFVHQGLAPGTQCYYSLWSHDGNTYSKAVLSRSSTLCLPDTAYPVSESFDDTVFSPPCWDASLMYRTTKGIKPAVSPYSGDGMLTFKCSSLMPGVTGLLASPPLAVSGDNFRISFWMYRDSLNLNGAFTTGEDHLDVLVGENPDASWADSIGTIYRDRRFAPAEATVGWHEYTFDLGPAGGNNPKFIFLRGVSGYSWDIFIDEVRIYNATQGVDESRADNAFFSVYPNPVRNKFTIETRPGDQAGPIQVQVTGMLGSVLFSGEYSNESKHEFSLEGTAPGIYLIRVTSGGRTGTTKIIKTN